MDAEKLQLLHSADDSEACEYPANFNREASISRVRTLKPKLEDVVGQPLIMDENVQDASYFTELTIFGKPHYMSGIGEAVGIVIGIRFSCFGNLITVYSTSKDQQIEQSTLKSIIAKTELNGFIYIDEASLEEPYTGRNRHLKGIGSWWIRYFDYL